MEDVIEEKMIRGTEDLFPITGNALRMLPNSCIGALTFKNKMKKSGKGTGVAISPNLILTVAHNIYDRYYRCRFEDLKFYLGADGEVNSVDFHEIESVRYLSEF